MKYLVLQILFCLNFSNSMDLSLINSLIDDSISNVISYSKFEISNINLLKDTLIFYSEHEFSKYPMGVYKNLEAIKLSNNKIVIKNIEYYFEPDSNEIQNTGLYEISLNSNKLLLWDGNKYSFKGFLIVSGKITDNSILFTNNISVGMNKHEFLNVFFKFVPNIVKNKITVVEIVSSVDQLWQYYTFQNNILISITFDDRSRIRKKK